VIDELRGRNLRVVAVFTSVERGCGSLFLHAEIYRQHTVGNRLNVLFGTSPECPDFRVTGPLTIG
jgi:hypothetical protein